MSKNVISASMTRCTLEHCLQFLELPVFLKRLAIAGALALPTHSGAPLAGNVRLELDPDNMRIIADLPPRECVFASSNEQSQSDDNSLPPGYVLVGLDNQDTVRLLNIMDPAESLAPLYARGGAIEDFYAVIDNTPVDGERPFEGMLRFFLLNCRR